MQYLFLYVIILMSMHVYNMHKHKPIDKDRAYLKNSEYPVTQTQ